MGICHWRKREPFAWTLPCDRAGDDYGSVKWRAADAKGKANCIFVTNGRRRGRGHRGGWRTAGGAGDGREEGSASDSQNGVAAGRDGRGLGIIVRNSWR